jgi:hypothetical protein
VEPVIDHDDGPETDRRTARGGLEIAVTTRQNAPAPDPTEIVGTDPLGYPKSRATQLEQSQARVPGTSQEFGRFGRQV